MEMQNIDRASVEEDHANSHEPKVISIMHQSTMRKPWILMPIGYYYNRDLQNAKQGDVLLFSDGKRREIAYKTIVPIINGLTDYLCRQTYVCGMQNVMRRWKMNAVFEGHNERVYSHDECLLIFLKESDSESNDGRKH